MFTFGKENQTESAGIVIFNEGNAGKVENVNVKVEKLGVDYPEDPGKKLPHYRVIFTDSNGGLTNRGFYYLDKTSHNDKYGTFDEAVQKQWNVLASIVSTVDGDPSVQASNPIEMLDKMMLKVRNLVDGKSFNVFANYGTKSNPKKFIQIRTWNPFIELNGTDEKSSKLKESNLDQMERLDVGNNSTGSNTDWV